MKKNKYQLRLVSSRSILHNRTIRTSTSMVLSIQKSNIIKINTSILSSFDIFFYCKDKKVILGITFIYYETKKEMSSLNGGRVNF